MDFIEIPGAELMVHVTGMGALDSLACFISTLASNILLDYSWGLVFRGCISDINHQTPRQQRRFFPRSSNKMCT